MNDPRLYVVSSPSGGGKTSLVNALLKKDDRVALSVSHTTRPMRPGEQDGIHYYFVDDDAFQSLVEQGAFLEHARVFDYRYGTGRKTVEKLLASGFDVLLDIDWQGARQIRRTFSSCCTIFILPPSIEELQKRLTGRGQDSKEVIMRRMRDAKAELAHWAEFDFLIINDGFDEALDDLHSIIRNGNPKRLDQERRHAEILADLLATR